MGIPGGPMKVPSGGGAGGPGLLGRVGGGWGGLVGPTGLFVGLGLEAVV